MYYRQLQFWRIRELSGRVSSEDSLSGIKADMSTQRRAIDRRVSYSAATLLAAAIVQA